MLCVALANVALLSRLKREPAWMLAWRINAYYCTLFAVSPRWAYVDLNALEFNALSLISVGTRTQLCAGVKLTDIDVVCDASSVYLQISKELKAFGIRFTSISKALLICAASVRRYMGSVVAHNDNYFSMLNSCLFTDGTYVSIPAGVSCPASLSTYFRMSSWCAGQFERTLIVANCESNIVYFEGCNAVKLAKAVVHAAVVELILKRGASLKYTTLQNWYVADRSGVYNLVTKRALCSGARSRIVWVQVEIGALATWKYPSSVLLAQQARAEFYSLSVSNNSQQVDTGTKVFHLAKRTASTVLAKSVLFGRCYNLFRALISLSAQNCRNYTRCDALVASADCVNRAVPIISVKAFPAELEYESLSSYVTANQLSYCKQRGIDSLSALKLVVIGHSYEVTKRLPLDVSLEVARLLFVS
ncbi:FeS cluster assembly protein sufB [Candidatus Hodgkinia cicadicola]|nr:FeS cluster assembly protein sufB [Candidatus Hodgkinia cicadicola]